MDNEKLIREIDAEIERLKQAREFLRATEGAKATGTRRSAPSKARKSRVLSPEARKRIADAQRKRWASRGKSGGGTGDGGYGISPQGWKVMGWKLEEVWAQEGSQCPGQHANVNADSGLCRGRLGLAHGA